MHDTLTCLNGRFLPASEASIPVSDRGFRFGDGVFETIRITDGVPYQWELHLARLLAGLSALRITPPAIDWKNYARTLLLKNTVRDGFLRLCVSRGSGSQGYLPVDATPTWLMECLPARPIEAPSCRLWLSSYTRPAASTLPANHKLAHGITSTLALLEAKENHCNEALLLTQTGQLSCASSANLFWITNDTIFTPALSTNCLDGTTRHTILQLTGAREIVATAEVLNNTHALFLTSSRLEIWPVHEISPQGRSLATTHPIIAATKQKFARHKTEYTLSNSAYWNSHP